MASYVLYSSAESEPTVINCNSSAQGQNHLGRSQQLDDSGSDPWRRAATFRSLAVHGRYSTPVLYVSLSNPAPVSCAIREYLHVHVLYILPRVATLTYPPIAFETGRYRPDDHPRTATIDKDRPDLARFCPGETLQSSL